MAATQGETAATQGEMAATQGEMAATQGEMAATQGGMAATQGETTGNLTGMAATQGETLQPQVWYILPEGGITQNMADWYPKTQAELIAWHDNFSTQAAINGTTLGLTAGIVTQTAADADNVLIMLNGLEAASAYRQALTEYKALLFNAPADTPTEPARRRRRRWTSARLCWRSASRPARGSMPG